MKKIFLLAVIVILCMIPMVSADCGNLTVLPSDTGVNYILWAWNTSYNITTLSIDSIPTSFDYNISNFILSGLDENSLHSIKIYSDTDTGCNMTLTESADIITTEQELFFTSINLYILFFFACLCIIIGMAYIPIIGFGAFLFGLLGLMGSMNNSLIMGILFFIAMIAGVIVGLQDI